MSFILSFILGLLIIAGGVTMVVMIVRHRNPVKENRKEEIADKHAGERSTSSAPPRVVPTATP